MHPLLSHYPISFKNYLFSWVSSLFSLALFRIFIAYVVCFKIHVNWLDLLFTTNGWDHKAYNIVMFMSILYFFFMMLVLIIHSIILVKIFFLLSPIYLISYWWEFGSFTPIANLNRVSLKIYIMYSKANKLEIGANLISWDKFTLFY